MRRDIISKVLNKVIRINSLEGADTRAKRNIGALAEYVRVGAPSSIPENFASVFNVTYAVSDYCF